MRKKLFVHHSHHDRREPADSLVRILQQRANVAPTSIAYSLRQADAGTVAQITFGELETKARAIGAWLQQQGASGARALLLYPFGLDFITGFYGCLYAGVIAVPLYPPRPNRPDPRLLAIMADAQPTLALTTSKVIKALVDFEGMSPALQQLQWVATDTLTADYATDWQGYAPAPSQLAFLQYTSGSTGVPKGVMVSHANVMHNAAMIAQAFAIKPQSTGLIWTPFFHDMGLIGGVVQPIYTGNHTTLMAPVDFLQQPSRWLRAISDERISVSGGPNFAYELCIEKITPEQCTGLDLACWEVAFSGAEPVRAQTLERFAAKFAPYGFQFRAFTPSLGMAESTLMTTCTPQAQAPTILPCDGEALAQHRVELWGPTSTTVQYLVSCGRPWLDQTVRIVHPEHGARCAENEVGEIWTAGPSVAGGYWQRPAETAQTFGAMLADTGEGPFLRTGDLGFLHGGELFITGRLKDLIIIRGRNYYPQDLEATAEQAHPALQPGGAAAFTIDVANEEKLVILQEVSRTYLRNLPVAEVMGRIRTAVTQAHEAPVHAIVLLRPGRLLKTTSGKVQRRANRSAYLQGELEVVGIWQSLSQATERSPESTALPVATLDEQAIAKWIRQQLARRLGLAPQTIDLHQPFAEYGLDSLAAVELVQSLDEWLHQGGYHAGLVMTDLWDFPTIAALTSHLAQKSQGEPVATAPTGPALPPAAPTPTPPADLADEIAQLTRLLNR